jgi:ABC-type sugar transport system permease subunit
MSTTSIALPGRDDPEANVALWLRAALIWHALLAVGALGSLVYIWAAANDGMALWLKLLLSLFGAATAVASSAAVILIAQRKHSGRTISLVINYLGFLAVFLGALQSFGIFVGFNALAETFGRGLPYLGVLFLGYFITVVGDRFEESNPALRRAFRQAAKIVVLAGVAGFLLAVGLLNGLRTFVGNYTSPLPFALTAVLLIFGLMLWIMWRRPTADAFKATIGHSEMLNGYLFLSPNLLGFLFFFAGPLLLSLYVSFTNWDAFGTRDWVGLDNYAKLANLTIAQLETPDQLAREVIDVLVYDELNRFTLFGRSFVIGAADKLFWLALGNTLQYVLLVVPLSVLPALLLANLLNSKLPGMTLFRAAYFLPTVAAVVGIALVWQWLFNSSVGYINYAITLAINFINNLGANLTDPNIRWLSSSDTALISIIIMASWQMVGYNTVLFLAGLQNIPGELYEAATVDGAGSWAKFRRVTIPLLAPTTFFVLTTTVIRAMQVFEEIFVLMGQYPAGPNNSTLSIVLYLYQKGFQRFEQGYASAIAWVLFLLIFGATLFQFQRQRTSGTAYDL